MSAACHGRAEGKGAQVLQDTSHQRIGVGPFYLRLLRSGLERRLTIYFHWIFFDMILWTYDSQNAV